MRQLEVLVPKTAADAVEALLADADFITRSIVTTAGGRLLVRVIVEAEKAEPILDLFEQRFGLEERFAAVILDVHGVLPRPAEPEPEPEPPESETKAKKKTVMRISREELMNDIASGTRVNGTYVATVVLSTIVAAVGLMQNSVAVIIGAMVIAPLLTPNMALALGTTLGDRDLIRRSLRANLIGLGIASGLALLMGVFVPFDATNSEVVARVGVGYADLVLALASGCAGALAFTSGVSAGLVGVMVAVALLPPLTTACMLIGAGQVAAGGQALSLLAANIICVNLAAVLTFVWRGVRPRTWWETDKARRATRRAMVIWAVLLVILISLVALTR